MTNEDISSTVDLLNINDNLEEECMICKDELSCYQCYTLPECKHTYHTHCLISWFRNGDARCPYCGNKGINNKPESYSSFRRSRIYNMGTYESQYLNDLRTFSNAKKNILNPAAIKIKKSFEKIKKLENDYKDYNQEFTEFKKKLKDEPVTYADARKKMYEYRTGKWKWLKKINTEKFKLVNNSYIVPLIIPCPINLT